MQNYNASVALYIKGLQLNHFANFIALPAQRKIDYRNAQVQYSAFSSTRMNLAGFRVALATKSRLDSS